MHYCGDELHSFQINQTSETQMSCCISLAGHEKVLDSDDYCCETELLKFSTDEFQNKSEQIVSRIDPPLPNASDLMQASVITTPDPDTDFLLTSLKFPSTGNYLKDVSLLTYICIYRI